MNISISDSLYNEINVFCELNDKNIEEIINSYIRTAFTLDKYGSSPFENNPLPIVEEPKKTTRKRAVKTKKENNKIEEIKEEDTTQPTEKEPIIEEKPKTTRRKVRIIKNNR